MRQLSGVDSLHVLEETSTQHMHTIKIAVVDPGDAGPLSIDEVRRWARETLLRIPPLRWQVHKIPLGLGRPVFVDAGPFDIDRHIVTHRLPAGAGPEEFDEVVSQIASVKLPRDRPLWELTVVEGLPEGRVGLVFKLHHAIMDGQASVRFLEVAFDGGELPYGPVPTEPEPVPTRAVLVSFAIRQQAKLWAELPRVTARTVRSIRDNRSRKKAGAPPVVNPLSGPSTRFNRWPLAERVYVDVTVPFADIKSLKDATGTTINEVFVTLCGGAIRRYLAAHGETPDRCLNCAHPISLRRDDQRDDFGNRTSYWYVSLGTDIADPLERMAAVKQSLDAARDVPRSTPSSPTCAARGRSPWAADRSSPCGRWVPSRACSV
jgi:diacylglycerol O-acyltransferase